MLQSVCQCAGGEGWHSPVRNLEHLPLVEMVDVDGYCQTNAQGKVGSKQRL
jgi:hypothetical protein